VQLETFAAPSAKTIQGVCLLTGGIEQAASADCPKAITDLSTISRKFCGDYDAAAR